ncbi:MAG: TetR/AcrR family transcriptional regulator [Polyangiaceae bacterium]
MARSREFDEAKALQAGMLVFWQQGYDATSLPDLLAAMGLSKSSFYQAFTSKEMLFERCLTHYADTMVGGMRRSLDEAATGLDFIRNTLLGVAEEAKSKSSRRGCLIMNTASEFGQRQPDVAKLVQRHSRRFEAVFHDALERAAADGQLSEAARAQDVARYLVCTLSGLKTLAKAGATRTELTGAAEIALGALH